MLSDTLLFNFYRLAIKLFRLFSCEKNKKKVFKSFRKNKKFLSRELGKMFLKLKAYPCN
ncbi:hypothetical protein cd3_083 [Carnobacterium phage cd3]|uniref:Uncharacterized protein n=1 Tax=Carnobacterium phage cd2 TaxID=2849244 RepID=A0AAE7VIM6_9CAUD|nr:hypothetical protein PQD68_gp083 [Carnobacterium phage cd2]QXP45209.1 hypothetical protein cd2_083 [Carnobacterium phage cd2]QXP45236.1 hypothetical protein cd3_083 [Carnobacterium phage cd3]